MSEHFKSEKDEKVLNGLVYVKTTVLPLDDKERMWIINNMGVEYMTYDKFKDIENRVELTDEEKEIAQKFYDSLKR